MIACQKLHDDDILVCNCYQDLKLKDNRLGIPRQVMPMLLRQYSRKMMSQPDIKILSLDLCLLIITLLVLPVWPCCQFLITPSAEAYCAWGALGEREREREREREKERERERERRKWRHQRSAEIGGEFTLPLPKIRTFRFAFLIGEYRYLCSTVTLLVSSFSNGHHCDPKIDYFRYDVM